MAKAVLLRQNILGKDREAVGVVDFEIPYTFTLKGKTGNYKKALDESKKHVSQIVIDLYNDMPLGVILIVDSVDNRHCKVFVDEDGEESTKYEYSVIVKTYVTDDMIKECYHRIMMYS